jgi:hypothetical protein
MTWQDKGHKASMGQFARAKAERMILIRFDGEPITADGKDFVGNKREELHFPVTFWDERSVSQKYKEGEAARLCMSQRGEAKMLPAASPPLMREILAEDEEESIMGRTFILSHTGTANDTNYKFREVRIARQAAVAPDPEEIEGITEESEPEAIPEAEDQEAKQKEKFKKEVEKRTKARKTKEKKPVVQDPPDEPIEEEPEEPEE